MPNWCSNDVTLRFPSVEEANEFKDHFDRVQSGENILDEFNNDLTILGFFVPEPDYNHQDQGWYWWRVNNWGTKWDCNIVSYTWNDDYEICLTFDTAWSPPIAIYEAIQEQGIYVTASYYEPGMCFVGSWEDGEEDHFEYSHIEDPDELREYIGEYLDDHWGISEDARMWLEEMKEENDSGVENVG